MNLDTGGKACVNSTCKQIKLVATQIGTKLADSMINGTSFAF